MSVYRYEEAIVKKMREITGDNRIIITPSENIYNVIPRIAKDEIKLPLIHMQRNNVSLLPQSHGMKMNGLVNNCVPLYEDYSAFNACDGKIHRFHAIPMMFSHTFEVWTRTRQENDELLRELIWFFSTMGEFVVDIPYGIDLKHVFTLQVDPNLTDGTNVLDHPNTGQIFIQSFNTICNDAYLWKSSEHNPTCVHTEIEMAPHPAFLFTEDQDYNFKTIEQSQRQGD